MRPPKCFDPSHTRSTWFLVQFWLNDNWLAVLVALGVVALIGVSKLQVERSLHVQSVSNGTKTLRDAVAPEAKRIDESEVL